MRHFALLGARFAHVFPLDSFIQFNLCPCNYCVNQKELWKTNPRYHRLGSVMWVTILRLVQKSIAHKLEGPF